jgi:hypothetical protein
VDTVLALLIWLLGQGIIVEQIVQVIKRIPFVKQRPKFVAVLLNVVAAAILEFAGLGPLGVALATFVEAVIAALVATGVSVGAYETIKSAKRMLSAPLVAG